MSNRSDRIKGVLLGQAAGDALGAGYETGKPVPASGATMCGGGFGFQPGEFTDDTQQAVCVAKGGGVATVVAEWLLEWYHGSPKDVGSQTRQVMRHAQTPGALLESSRHYARAQEGRTRPPGWYPGTGNGSLMRTGPAALPFLGVRPAIALAARDISDLTHADPWSGDACVLWSLAIDKAVRHGGRWSIELMDDGLAFIPAERREFWRDRITEATHQTPRSFAKGNGSAVGAFMAALSCVHFGKTLEEGLQLAVAAGGDTDTVAAIAGSLLGAIHGASAVPATWRSKIWGWPGRTVAADLEQLALEAAGITA